MLGGTTLNKTHFVKNQSNYWIINTLTLMDALMTMN